MKEWRNEGVKLWLTAILFARKGKIAPDQRRVLWKEEEESERKHSKRRKGMHTFAYQWVGRSGRRRQR